MEVRRRYFALKQRGFQGAGVHLGCVLTFEQSFEIEGKLLMRAERCSEAKVESPILPGEFAGA